MGGTALPVRGARCCRWAGSAERCSPHRPTLPSPAVQVTRHKRCRIRVTVGRQPGEWPQAGHKVMLNAAMVSHAALAQAGTLVNVQRMSEEESEEEAA